MYFVLIKGEMLKTEFECEYNFLNQINIDHRRWTEKSVTDRTTLKKLLVNFPLLWILPCCPTSFLFHVLVSFSASFETGINGKILLLLDGWWCNFTRPDKMSSPPQKRQSIFLKIFTYSIINTKFKFKIIPIKACRSSKKLGFVNPTVQLRHWDVTSLFGKYFSPQSSKCQNSNFSHFYLNVHLSNKKIMFDCQSYFCQPIFKVFASKVSNQLFSNK